MCTRPDIYADGIGEIHFINGMVRLDLMTLQAPPKDSNEPPHPESCGRVIMTPQGFLTAFAAMQQLADKLVEAGVLQKAPQ